MGQICKCKHFCGLFASHSFTNFINEHISGGATPVLIHLFMSQLHYIFRRWPRLLRKCLFFQLLQRLILFETALQLLLRKSLQWVQNIILLQINLYNEDCHEKFWKSVFSSIVTRNKSIWFSQFHHKIKDTVWSVNNLAAGDPPLLETLWGRQVCSKKRPNQHF